MCFPLESIYIIYEYPRKIHKHVKYNSQHEERNSVCTSSFFFSFLYFTHLTINVTITSYKNEKSEDDDAGRRGCSPRAVPRSKQICNNLNIFVIIPFPYYLSSRSVKMTITAGDPPAKGTA